MRKSSQELVRAMVEQLEGRMLLSVWAGTWKVQGVELMADPQAQGDKATYTARSFNATITDKQGAPGQYDISVPLFGFTGTLTGNDTEISLANSSSDHEQYLKLRMVDPGVILVTEASVDYQPGRQGVSAVGFLGGVGTQRAATIMPFAWDGQYTAHDFMLDVGSDGGSYASQFTEPTITVVAKPVGSGQYTVGEVGDSTPTMFSPSGGKLVSRYAGPGNGEYKYKYEEIWRGANGRLYHVGGNANFNTTTGQLDSASFDATYTDPHVNLAPVLDKSASPQFAAIDEDNITSDGTSVAALLTVNGSSTVRDVNANDGKGIAVVGADTKHGKWQYSLDGSTWQDMGKVTGSSALLLADTARLRFAPSANYFGSLAKAITFRAWDQSSGTNGGRASVNASGKTTAFSQASDVASLVVNPVNDAPVISGNGVALTYRAGGKPVSIFSSMKITDVDSKLLSSATVQLSGGYTAGTDVIAYRGPSTIQAAINAATGTVTLSSATPMKLGTYLAALKGIVFSTPTQHGDVTVTFTVADDLGLASSPVVRVLQIV